VRKNLTLFFLSLICICCRFVVSMHPCLYASIHLTFVVFVSEVKQSMLFVILNLIQNLLKQVRSTQLPLSFFKLFKISHSCTPRSRGLQVVIRMKILNCRSIDNLITLSSYNLSFLLFPFSLLFC